MRRGQALVVTAVVLAAVSACGKPGADAPQVATLASASPAAASPSAGPQRPRERIDMTSDERDALQVPYRKCLKSHGLSDLDAKKAEDAAKAGGPAADAARFCEEHYLPLPPWEQDPANPEARDFAVAVVKCLKSKGVRKVEVDPDGISIALGGDDNDPRSISMGLDLEPACERQVAAQK
jgi:hypothetical protein